MTDSTQVLNTKLGFKSKQSTVGALVELTKTLSREKRFLKEF